MRHRALSGLALLGFALAACSSDQAGPAVGRAESVIEDSPNGSPQIVGTLAGDVFASLSTDGLTWVDLGSPNGITVVLQNRDLRATVHGEVDVPAGTYSRVRLVFEGVIVRLVGGSIVGGNPIAGDATLTLGGSDQRVEVVIPVPTFTIEADPAVQRTVLFELRSHLWLTTTALAEGTIQDAALQGAVLASTRLDPR